jgi:hypothetical protein
MAASLAAIFFCLRSGFYPLIKVGEGSPYATTLAKYQTIY